MGGTSWRALLGRKGSLLHQHFLLWGYGQTEVTLANWWPSHWSVCGQHPLVTLEP